MIGFILEDSMHILRFFKSRIGKKHDYKFRVLLMLDHAGRKPMSFIAEQFMIAKPNMTSIIDDLIEKGLVERLPDEADRRVINISLSNKGRRLIKLKKKQFRERAAKAFADFSREELRMLKKSFGDIRKIIDSKVDSDD